MHRHATCYQFTYLYLILSFLKYLSTRWTAYNITFWFLVNTVVIPYVPCNITSKVTKQVSMGKIGDTKTEVAYSKTFLSASRLPLHFLSGF